MDELSSNNERIQMECPFGVNLRQPEFPKSIQPKGSIGLVRSGSGSQNGSLFHLIRYVSRVQVSCYNMHGCAAVVISIATEWRSLTREAKAELLRSIHRRKK